MNINLCIIIWFDIFLYAQPNKTQVLFVSEFFIFYIWANNGLNTKTKNPN